jgi:tetratricopeptide (TPR) repeat protein
LSGNGATGGIPRPASHVLTGWLLVISAATIACYLPALSAGFVWDDNDWLTENPLVHEPDGLIRIWTGAERLQYYPVLFTAFRIEYSLWGLNPLGYHLVNIVLHALNAFLLGWLLTRLKVPAAFWVALLFAVHPIQVESVAWVTELKNVLSGLFYLATLHAFVTFEERGKRRDYLLAVVCFALAMLSKTATATLPVALLLLLLWKNRRLGSRDALRVTPFLLVAATLAAITVRLESGLVQAVQRDFDFTLWQRAEIAARALLFYPWKLIVPYPLIFNYPRWDLDASGAWRLLPVVVALALGLWLARLWKRGSLGTACAIAFYVVTISPALGLFDVYAFRYSFVADHFQYLAGIGLLILLVQLGVGIGARFGDGGTRSRSVAIAIALVLALLTFIQARAYRDLPALWQDTQSKNPNSWIAHHSLALHYKDQGSLELALEHANEAIRCKPSSAESLTARGLIHTARNQTEHALEDLDRAVALDPTYPQARLHRASVLLAAGRPEEAIRDLDRFLSTNPDYAPALQSRGRGRAMLAQYTRALIDLDRAIELGAGAAAYVDRGSIHAQLKRFELAMADAENALTLDPSSARAYLLRGMVHQLGAVDHRLACADWGRACDLGDCRYFEQRCGR